MILALLLLAQAGAVQKTRVCDKTNPARCAAVDATGAVSVSGSISASTTGRATAAAPTYVEGTDNPLSVDLAGNIRTLATVSTAGLATEATLSAIKTDVDKIPASPSTDRTTAAAPFSLRLSDGAAFYDARSIRLLTSADVVDVSDRSARLLGHVTVDNASLTVAGPLTDTQLRASAVPVSGTVAVSNSFALDATLTSGTQKAIVRGGAKGATAAADVTGTANGADHQGLDVQVQNASLTVAGTVTTTPPANASTNVAQLAGTTTDTNSGLKSAGTLRVVIATDQPALTNKLLVTPDSVALPANQSVNVAQVGGTNTLTGGTAGSLGVGGLAAEGGAISGNPVYSAGRGFNAIAFAPRYCDKMIAVTTLSTTATVQQIAAVANQKIYICGYLIKASTATTGINLKWVEGTGSNCVTGTADVTPTIFTTPTAAPATANWTLGPFGSPGIPWMATASDALCINQSATTNATTLSGVIFYTQN